jgi:hypothetical protein
MRAFPDEWPSVLQTIGIITATLVTLLRQCPNAQKRYITPNVFGTPIISYINLGTGG